MGKEEDINTLCNIIGKAHRKGTREFRELMNAWEDLDRLASGIGKSSEVTEKKILALAALRAWGAGENG